MRTLKALLAPLLILTLLSCSASNTGYVELILDQAPARIALLGDQMEWTGSKNNYVSVAPISDRYYAIANYADLFLFDKKEATLCKLKAFDVTGRSITSEQTQDGFPSQASAYNPTGVYYHEQHGLFVANYKVNNILMGDVDTENCRFTIKSTLSSNETLGPENVFFDPNSGLLVSANYDAGTITAFDVAARRQVWVAAVPQAHGVAISGELVYATGLTERKIYEIDVASGTVIRSRGKLGWNPARNEYLWPTSIYPLRDGNLVVSDAQSGYVSIVDNKSLNTIRYTGGNGPADTLLNYPYAAVPYKGEIIIMSSMRGEILFVDPFSMKVSKKFSIDTSKWPSGSQVVPRIFGHDWDGYVNMGAEHLKIGGSLYRAGFGNLHPVEGGPILRAPDIGSLFNPGAYMYFLQGVRTNQISYFFSSSSTALIGIVEGRGNPDILIPEQIDIDSWISGSSLVSRASGTTPISHLESGIRHKADAYYKALARQHWLKRERLYELLFSALSYETFLSRLDRAFSSPAGREFKLTYDRCHTQSCDPHTLKEAAAHYYMSVRGEAYLALDEYMLVGMLTGTVSPYQTGRNHIEYSDCALGAYYPGHDLSALQTESLDDYLSAVDLNGSVVCISIPSATSVIGLDIVWNDIETAPRKMEVLAKRFFGDTEEWTLLRRVDDIHVEYKDGYARSRIEFEADQRSEFQLRITDGGSLNRLVVRAIRPIVPSLPNASAKQSTDFGFIDCPGAGFYENHGIETLETPSLNDYLSAIDIHSSSVCVSTNGHHLLDGIRLGWYSAPQIGQEMALYGAEQRDFRDEVLLAKKAITSFDTIGGYVFSDVKIEGAKRFPFYRMKLLAGKGDNRLILRHLSLLRKDFLSVNSLAYQAREISALLRYGEGISSAPKGTEPKLSTLENLVLQSSDAHCGNYALVFVNRLPPDAKWSVFDVKAMGGLVHTVVEVDWNARKFVYDPTLGIEYRCSLNSLLRGWCDYTADTSYHRAHPALVAYRGAGFFYGAEVLRTYTSAADLISSYF